MLYVAQPDVYNSWLASLLGGAERFASLTVWAFICGKESGNTTVEKTRVIMPMPALLNIIDALLVVLLEPFLETLLVVPGSCWIGGRKYTQVLDITHGLTAVIEKSMDLESAGAVAQADIQQYYDSLVLLLVCRWLEERGVPGALLAAVLRHQMLPNILVEVGGSEVAIDGRSERCLTGSRIAGLMSRIPPVDVIQLKHEEWKSRGFQLPNGCLQVAVYIDNLYSVGKSAHDTTSVLEDFGRELRQRWRCLLKPSSKEVMVAKGNSNHTPADSTWKSLECMRALGHLIQHDGGINVCFDFTIRCLWRSFFANAGSASAKGMPVSYKLRLLDKATKPVLSFRLTRWPFQSTKAHQLDKVQRRMLAMVMDLRLSPGQDAASFNRQRAKEASKQQVKSGKWSTLWASRVVAWHDHLQRPANSGTWAAQLAALRPPQELQQRRWSNGRPQTRAESGWIRPRWYEGIEKAASYIHKGS